MKIFSVAQIKAWDAFTISNEPVKSIDLMERAARACFDWITKNIDNNITLKIFCGKGNNGGDGLAIARHLVQKNLLFCQIIVLLLRADSIQKTEQTD